MNLLRTERPSGVRSLETFSLQDMDVTRDTPGDGLNVRSITRCAKEI